MKNLLTLLILLPLNLFSQYVKVPTHYNSKEASEHILHGDLKFYLSDTVELTIEKKRDKYKTSDVSKDVVISKVNKVFSKGNPEYSSRTNGGYTFTISVVDPKDETNVTSKVVFTVDAFTQKIKSVEILKG